MGSSVPFELGTALTQTDDFQESVWNGSDGQELPQQFNKTDMGNAERLLERYGENLLYIDLWGKWLSWDTRRWKIDAEQTVRRYAKDTVRAIYKEAAFVLETAAGIENEDEKNKRVEMAKSLFAHARKSESAARVQAMLSLAQPDVCVLPEALDTDPWLLNVENGTLDLRTGRLRKHDPRQLLTKLVPVKYNSQASCLTWEDFLQKIFNGKQEVVDFVQKAVGYSLTGDTREQCLFLLYGTGANGKSTFLEALSALLGDYVEQADFTSFLHREGDGIRNDLAKLRAARFVSAVEVEEGRRLSEVVIKQVTGGDTITARFLFHEFFSFQPTFKLWLAGNHKPVIRGTDYAIWRRIRLVPFSVTISEAEQDKELPAKLKAELPGILAWAVRGCLAWQKDGRLLAPEAVKLATSEYRAEMDVIGTFLDESCVLDANLTTPAGMLYDAYGHWCERAGEKPLVQKVFGSRLRERGLENDRNSVTGRKQWKGLGLKPEES